MRYLVSCILLFLFCVSCTHTSFFTDRSFVKKEWVINTLSEPYLQSKVFQKTPTLLTQKLMIQGDALYGVRVYDRQRGNLQWFFPVIGGIEGSVEQQNKRIFFGGSDGFFYCLEKRTGRILWKFFTNSQNVGTPFVLKNTVYFLTNKNKLYALNVTTGDVLWVYSHASQQVQTLTIQGISRPVVDDQYIYVSFSDGVFLALRQADRKIIWKQQISRKNSLIKDVNSHPVVYKNLIYISSYDGGLFCLDKKTGKIVWKYQVGSYSNPVVQGKKIYYSTVDQQVVSLNRFSGKKIWSQSVMSLATQPVIYQSLLIYGLSEGGLHFVRQSNGKLVQTLDLFKGIQATPSIDQKNKELFVFSKEAWLYKLKLL